MSFTKNPFIKNLSILVIGTIIAQALPIVLSPILSRLFDPTDFAAYGIYMSIVTVLVSISCGAFEYSIILPKNDNNSLILVTFALSILSIFCVLIFVLIIIFHSVLFELFDNKILNHWLYLIPISVLLYGALNVFTNWLNRKKRYKLIALNKINKNWVLSIAQLIFGLLKFKKMGLILGQIIGDFFSALFVIINFFSKNKLVLVNRINIAKLKLLLKEYKKIPLFTLPTIFLNNISSQMITVLIGIWFNPLLTGAYYFSLRLLSAPMALIGSSITQIYFQRFTEIVNEGKENPEPMLLNIWKILAVIAFVPSLILFIWGKDLFVFIFGNNWAEAGVIASLMAPMIFFIFISSPTSSSFIVLKKQNYNLYFGVFEYFFRLGSFYLGYYYNNFYLGLKTLIVFEITNIVLYNWLMLISIRRHCKLINKIKII